MNKMLLLSVMFLSTIQISAMRRPQQKVEDITAPLKQTVIQQNFFEKRSDETRSVRLPETKKGKNNFGDWVMHVDSDGKRVLKYIAGANEGRIFAADSNRKELNPEETEKLYTQHAQHFPVSKIK